MEKTIDKGQIISFLLINLSFEKHRFFQTTEDNQFSSSQNIEINEFQVLRERSMFFLGLNRIFQDLSRLIRVFLIIYMSIEQDKQLVQISFQIAQQGYVTKTFVFQKSQTQQSQIFDFRINMFQEKIDLCELFQRYCPLIQYKISIYNPQANQFIFLNKINAEVDGKIPKLLLQTKIILIRYKKKVLETLVTEQESASESRIQQSRQKKDRSKERTIGESIQLVKQWRAVHFTSNKQGTTKMSLSQAAKVIGVSKKSLDDYYYQLRLGEYYNFDFSNHLSEKIGILRAYVKQFKPSRDIANKNLRHPKNLKIIQMFHNKKPAVKAPTQTFLSPIIQELQSPSFKSLTIKQEQILVQNNKDNISLKDVILFQDNFFKNFQFLLDDPTDPFISMNVNFSKKQSSQEFLFF